MQVRVSFEPGAGVCVWSDDEAARERWPGYGIELEALPLPADLVQAGAALLTRIDASLDWSDPGGPSRWTPAEAGAFAQAVAEWTAQVRAALAPAIAVREAAGARSSAEPAAAAGEAEEPSVEGEVVVVGATEAMARAWAWRFAAEHCWHETLTWAVVGLRHRTQPDGARSPERLLAALEGEPGFICGWWQERAGGPEVMLAGDPTEHAIAAVRARDAVALANFLAHLRVVRLHAVPAWAEAPWAPSRRHRQREQRGTWWEWWQFFRAAGRALRGAPVSAGYRAAERDRLRWHWTHRGSCAGWPAHVAEAVERSGLRRVAPGRWAR